MWTGGRSTRWGFATALGPATIVAAIGLLAVGSVRARECHCLPADACWPDHRAWYSLNSTVGGRLVATVPIGSVCHDPHYDEVACAALQNSWTLPPTHYESSSSVMEMYWANRSCDPFTTRSSPCELGNYVSYAVNASGPQDIAAAVRFAKQHNIRFVVRNTGHDFLGRSTGVGALAAWTHHLKDVEMLDWSTSFYTGPAVKMGAGIQGFEAIAFAEKHGRVVVGGYCPTVGLAGGFTQGGGHSHLSTMFGLAADQTLEFEVVTATGEITTASPTKNADLYWALSGGGAGTYAIVTAVTVRSYPDVPVGGGLIFIDPTQTTKDNYWKAMSAFYALLPQLTDAGLALTFAYNATLFTATITAYNQSSAQVKSLLSPFSATLSNLSITAVDQYADFPSYNKHWLTYYPLDGPVGTFWQFGGRLVPRDAIEHNLTALMSTFEFLSDNGVFAGVTVLNASSKTGADNAVLPAWRSATVLYNALQQWDQSAAGWDADVAALRRGTSTLDGRLDEVTPGSGNYVNEADPFNPNWKTAFYGENYGRLLAIKKKWDPEGILYGRENVGSDMWAVGDDGRMCRARS